MTLIWISSLFVFLPDCTRRSLVTLAYTSNGASAQESVRKFPEGFTFGAGTSAYQIEGAWNEDGKSDSIWDHSAHSLDNNIFNNATGDIATNSYHLYKRDVEIMRELGLDFYRFSFSWTRILPSGFPDKINLAGVEYYNNLIDEMLKYNIQPMVTLYHWDLPQKLQDLGGWANPHVIGWFRDYAQVVFNLYGDRVKNWITINEPHIICYRSYGTGDGPPRLTYSGVADYICAKNLLLAHATVYHLYNEEFRPFQNGNIFITLSSEWFESETGERDDAAEDTIQFEMGQYSHPIFSKTGDWPPVMKERIAVKSIQQGFPRSRLPEFTPEEVNYIRGSSDFFGLNHYATYIVYRNVSNFEVPSFEDDLGVEKYQRSEWFIDPEVTYVANVPKGFYKLLMKLKNDYDLPIWVIENGLATDKGLNDNGRVTYYYGYLNAMLDAIEDGVDVRSFSAWSLMDNLEWIYGYDHRFGLYEVDFEDDRRPRTPRKSAFAYKQIVRTRALDDTYEPDIRSLMTIDEGH